MVWPTLWEEAATSVQLKTRKKVPPTSKQMKNYQILGLESSYPGSFRIELNGNKVVINNNKCQLDLQLDI